MSSVMHPPRPLRCGLLAAAAVLAMATTAQAAAITWGTETDIAGDADVSTNGTLVAAFNFGGSTTTVNGVLFDGLLIGQPQVVSITFGAFYTLTIDNENAAHTLKNFDTSSTSAPFSGLTPAYQSLLGNSAGHVFGDRTTTLTIAGLTSGQTYEFQAWVNDSSSAGCCSFGISLDNLYLDPNTSIDNAGDVVAGGLGQFVIGTFIADGTQQQVIGILRDEVGGGINGFQLRAVQVVPEPGTAGLLALALGALLVRRRRS